jgi:acetyl-CoA synthetase
MITPLVGVTPLKPGSAALPFLGANPVILDDKGQEIEGPCEGVLALKSSWPGQARTLYGDHPRFMATYLTAYPGYYFPGDGARRDADGYYWITGRIDDVINIAGHRLGTAEIESALVLHPDVVEAAVVGYPHPIKGQGIYAFVTVANGIETRPELEKALIQLVRHEIGAIATPQVIQWAPQLPKTRSGKIMRRILRKVAAGEVDGLGDTSTLADPKVVEEIVARHRQIMEKSPAAP